MKSLLLYWSTLVFIFSIIFSTVAFGQSVIANDDVATTDVNTAITILVLVNDEGSNLSLTLNQQPNNGQANLANNTSITYTPSANYVGIDSFTYLITNVITNQSSEATVTVNVIGEPPPLIEIANDIDTTVLNTPITIAVLANDIGTNLSFLNISSPPSNGTAVFNSDSNNIIYTPNADFIGTDTFEYKATEINLVEDSALVIITVIDTVVIPPAINFPPIPDTLSFCTQPMSGIEICNTWIDPNGDNIAIDIEGSHTTFDCSLVSLNDTCIRYTPLPGFIGTDTVSLIVCDDRTPALCSTSIIVVYIGCEKPIVNQDIVAITPTEVITNGVVFSNENALTGAFLAVTNNDVDPCGNNLLVTDIISQPSNGAATLVGGEINYIPTPAFVGTDELTYATCNNCGECDTATVLIEVLPADLVCHKDTVICIAPFTELVFCPNFCEIDNIDTITQTTNLGIVNAVNDSCFSFVPPAVFDTTALVTFVACDSLQLICDTVKLTVNVDPTCGTNAPIAADDFAVAEPNELVSIDVLANDTDIDAQELTVTEILAPPNCGAAEIVLNTIVYTATSTNCLLDSLTYLVCDESNLCDTATVLINLNANCGEVTTYCLAPLAPTQICVSFCDLLGSDTINIEDTRTTFNCSITILSDSCIQYIPLPGFQGSDVIEIVGCNEFGICDTVLVPVHIGCVEPTPVNDSITIANGTPTLLAILANDTHPCEEPLGAAILNLPVGGEIVNNQDSTFTYTPNAGFSGIETLTYVACSECEDGPTMCDTAFIVIDVLPFDPVEPTIPIKAQPDVEQTPFETPIAIEVLENDLGENIVINSVDTAQNGIVTLQDDQTILYTPNAGFEGPDYFFYEICDESESCRKTLVSVTVLPEDAPNQAPFAHNDLSNTITNIPVTIPVLTNDNDPENESITIDDVVELPPNGEVITNPDGTITYTPNSDFIGIDSFNYIICDDNGACDVAQVVVLVAEEEDTPLPNYPPTANNDVFFTEANIPISAHVLTNDTNPENLDEEEENDQILTVAVTSVPSNGTVINVGNGVLDYQPTAGFQGTDYFTYLVCDNGQPNLCDTAYVTIQVGEATNQPPIAVDDMAFTPLNVEIDIPILANDSDPNHDLTSLTLTIVTLTNNGEIDIIANGVVNYDPNVVFVGVDSFSYAICDPLNACDTAWAFITVLDTLIELDAEPDIAYVYEGDSVLISVLLNDFGENIQLNSVIGLPQFGAIGEANAETGVFLYIADNDLGLEAGEVMTDNIIYTICDQLGVCDTTIVAINILGVGTENLPPTASNDVFNVAPNTPVSLPVLQNDIDPNGDSLVVTELISLPDDGTVTIDEETGELNYVPPTNFIGCEQLMYLVCDSENVCDTAEVIIQVGIENCFNQAPIANDDVATTIEGMPVGIFVLENDGDPNNDSISLIISTSPPNGTLEILNDFLIYTSETDFTGIDYFTYILCDDGQPSLCDTAYVSIVVNMQEVDAEPDIEYTTVNTPIDILVVGNDSGTKISIESITTSPANGFVTETPGTGVITYEPEADFVGVDYFEYQICDTTGVCDETLVTVYVLPASVTNIAPNAVNDMDTTPVNTPVTINVLENDTDPLGGDTLLLTDFTNPENGLLTYQEDNATFIYTPNAGFEEDADFFTYVICDDGNPLFCDTAVVTITVGSDTYTNQFPVAEDDNAITETNIPITIPVLANDTDPDNDNLTVDFVTLPANGVINNMGDSVVYSPSFGYTGGDFFGYVICDNGLPTLCDTAYVSIFVEGTTPTISLETIENTPIDFCLEDHIAGISVDTISVLQTPENGSLIIINCIQYIPDPTFTGTDTLTVLTCDENDNCVEAIIFINVMPNATAPIAVNDNTSTLINTPVVIAVLENDTDPDEDIITSIIPINPPTVPDAEIEVNLEDLTVTYIPGADFVGVDSFSYVITDVTGLLSDTAWVTIVIDTIPTDTTSNGQEIIAVDDLATTNMEEPVTVPVVNNDELANITLLEIDSIWITIEEEPQQGIATIEETTSITYTPELGFAGIDTLTYVVCVFTVDTNQICDTAEVVIVVEPDPAPTDCEPVLASGFSPNGDGVNDAFLISGIDCFTEGELSLTIFNRWGNIVYDVQAYNNDKAWTGIWQKNGKEVTVGTYFYAFIIQKEDTIEKMSGFVEVQR